MRSKNKLSELISSSVILGALERFASFLYRQLFESIFGRIFTAYGQVEDTYRRGFFSSVFRRDKRSKLVTRMRYGISRAFERNSFLGFLSKCTDKLLGCRLKVYGLFALSFGIYTALMYIFKRYAFYLENSSIDHLYFGIGAVAVSLLLIPSSQTLAKSLVTSRIMKYILSDTLGMRLENIADKKSKKGGSGTLFFICGIAAGVLTYFVSPFYMLFFVLGLIVLAMIFSYPEVGVLLMLFASPFIVFLPHPSFFLSGIVLITVLSFAVKLIRGKRTVKFEFIDFVVLIFAALIFFGGIVSVEPRASLGPALMFVSLMLVYFLVVNLMRTKLWLRRCITMLTSSAVAVSLYGIWQYFTNAQNENWIDPEMFEDISGRAVSTFENPNMLAEYLIILLPFVLAMFLYSQKSKTKAVYLLSLVSMVLCLVYTWSRSAWVGAIVGLTVFFLMYSKKTIYALVLIAAALPFVSFLLPNTLLERFTSIGNVADSSTMYRVYLWKSVARIISDFFGGGIGIGEGAFGYVYPMYTYAGMESAPHSHSIYLQITLEIGIVGICVFLLALFLFSQGSFEYAKRSSDKRSRLMSAAGFSGIVAALVQGSADYIWYNYRVFFIFWAVIGIVCAYRRISYDTEDATLVRPDENSAQLDIKLSGKA